MIVAGNITDWVRCEQISSTVIARAYDNTLWAWGYNSRGTCGDNSTVDRSSPVSVVGGFTDWLQVGYRGGLGATVVARRANGTLWAWGLNNYGQLGNNNTVSRSSPVSVVGGFTDWIYCSGGSFGIRSNGTLWAWGRNANGELGTNDTLNRSSPVSVVGGYTDWTQVSSAAFSELNASTKAIRANGTLWAWGTNFAGQLGTNDTVARSSPVSVVGGFTDWSQVSTSTRHSVALRTNGTAWTWGLNNRGAIGDNTTIDRSSPVSVVGGFTDWTQVMAGLYSCIGLRANGTAWTWGFNDRGQLGDASTVSRSSPVSVIGGFTDWIQVAQSNTSSGVRTPQPITPATLWGWGPNAAGQIGNNNQSGRSSPVSGGIGITTWVEISKGRSFSLALRADGTAWAWGRQTFFTNGGNLGDNTSINRSSPVSVVGGFTDWRQISAGRYTSMALRTNGTAWAWGRNYYGALGINATGNRSSPVSVVGNITDWIQISNDGNAAMALRSNGTIWGWGYNGNGRIGDNTTVSRSSPVSVVGGFTDWIQIAAGYKHSTAIRANGTAWCWGLGQQGALGNNATSLRSSPVSVVGGYTDWTKIAAGWSNTVALRANGTAWCWGSGQAGALGDNSTVDKSSPVSVVGGFTDWVQVATGADISLGGSVLALRANGTAWGWGNNFDGNLGNNSTPDRSSPVSVVGGFTDWIQIAADSTDLGALALRTG